MNRLIKNIGIICPWRRWNKDNGIFDPAKYHQYGEGLEYPFILLKRTLQEKGIEINTLDTRPLEEFDSVLFFNYPMKKNIPAGATPEELHNAGKKIFLFLFENDLIWPENAKTENHIYFDKIFTWNDLLVDGKKYVKLILPNKIPELKDIDLSKKDKLCALISTNQLVEYPQELYSERVRAIRWFERHHPGDFDLYGHGWDSDFIKRPSVSSIIKLLCLLKPIRKLLDKDYFSSYRGPIVSKNEVLSRYKFSICYENSRDVPGYITEKIFDCFFAGTIPVYWGAPNITDFIPANTFVDKRNYPSYESLYEYISNMPQKEYEGCIRNIRDYISGEKIKMFSAEHFVDVILNNII